MLLTQAGAHAGIQSSLESVVYYASFKLKRLSVTPLRPLPPQKAINETKMNTCEGKKVIPLFKGRIVCFCFLIGLVLVFEDDGSPCNPGATTQQVFTEHLLSAKPCGARLGRGGVLTVQWRKSGKHLPCT